MGIGLRPIALWSVTSKQTVDQDSRPASRIAVYHHAAGMPPRCRHGGLRREPLKPTIPRSEDNPLHATVTANERHRRCQEWLVVLVDPRIHEMNRCNVAFTAFSSSK